MSKYRNYVLVLNDHKTWSHLDGAKIIAISDDEKEALLKESKPVDKRFDNPAISKEVMGDILKAGGHERSYIGNGYSVLHGGTTVRFWDDGTFNSTNNMHVEGTRPSWTLAQE